MALAGSEFGLLACAKERTVCDFRGVVCTVPVALRVCGEAEKRYSEEDSNNTRKMYTVILDYCGRAARNGVWTHVTLT